MYLPLPLLLLWLASLSSPVFAVNAGSFSLAGQTLVSAMMVCNLTLHDLSFYIRKLPLFSDVSR